MKTDRERMNWIEAAVANGTLRVHIDLIGHSTRVVSWDSDVLKQNGRTLREQLDLFMSAMPTPEVPPASET